jgi:hypothetical protein
MKEKRKYHHQFQMRKQKKWRRNLNLPSLTSWKVKSKRTYDTVKDVQTMKL